MSAVIELLTQHDILNGGDGTPTAVAPGGE